MAANAAHLTRTLNEKPSVFEVIAQESLHSTVQPALRRVFEFIASLNPRKLNWLVRWFDEIFLFFNSVVQYNYIRHYAASFAEHFYGLRRISLKTQIFQDGLHLPSREEKLSILLLTLFPYVRQKLNDLTDSYRLDEIDGITPKGWKGTFRKCLLQFQASFHLIYEFISLMQYIAYMSGKSDCPSVLLRLTSLTLKYVPGGPDPGERTWSDFWGDIKTGNLKSAGVSFEMVGTVLLRSMEFGAFFIQFLKWWDDKGPKMDLNKLPIPEVPELDIRASDHLNKCPLCHRKWKIPTVVPVSGYVYCYKCIVDYLNQDSFCPVTKYPTNKNDLIRLYLPNLDESSINN